MKKFLCFYLLMSIAVCARAQDATPAPLASQSQIAPTSIREEEALLLYDDKRLLDGFAEKYSDINRDTAMQMMEDESLSSYQLAAVIRIFRQKFSDQIVSDEKEAFDKILLRCLNRSPSPFVQVEAMCALIQLDRYKYFHIMIPLMIQKLDHYNKTVNETAFSYLNAILDQPPIRSREAQVVFDSLRKILFLSRNRLSEVKEPGPRLSQKLKLLRWSIKIIGTGDLDKLPKDVIGLL